MTDDKKNPGGGDHVHGPGCGCGHDHSGGEHASPGREVPDFPTEVTFKAIFRNRPYTMETLKNICQEAGLDAEISDRGSSKGNFISYTVTAMFPSDDALKTLCARIGQVEGFYTMF
ncbi:MAG: DUF493 family protein [Spirochaetes bacterium]|nr:DUF493 family protein [Spirochaetota bacterium]HPA73583.1 DUF493 family protein [Spirochaetota bacterium]